VPVGRKSDLPPKLFPANAKNGAEQICGRRRKHIAGYVKVKAGKKQNVQARGKRRIHKSLQSKKRRAALRPNKLRAERMIAGRPANAAISRSYP